MGDYNTECPRCGSGIRLAGFTACCDIPICSDGWGYEDGGIDSSDEVFRCPDCGVNVPSDWVFKGMDKTKAKKKMDKAVEKEEAEQRAIEREFNTPEQD
jgi:hypothetical protein